MLQKSGERKKTLTSHPTAPLDSKPALAPLSPISRDDSVYPENDSKNQTDETTCYRLSPLQMNHFASSSDEILYENRLVTNVLHLYSFCAPHHRSE